MNQKVYDSYIKILNKELIPALGCTEPIAIAYAAAKAREVLGKFPEQVVSTCSGNIVKNVKGVVVPATGGLRGIEAATLIGAVGGDPARELEVLTSVTDEDRAKVRELLEKKICHVKLSENKAKLHIIVEMTAGTDSALVEIMHTHTNIIRIEKNGQVLMQEKAGDEEDDDDENIYQLLNLDDIVAFANEVKLEDVADLLKRQVEYNSKIAEVGLTETYGANVGKTLVENYGTGFEVMARALPAAGSDARMGGCELPVVINSGSGNQGMTVSLPVIEYAKELQSPPERLYRALTLSNLTAIYQKEGIGRLSAYCGAVSAGASAGAGIAYLLGGGRAEAAHTIVNALAISPGITCDGAKPSCAGKIAAAVDAGILGYYMFLNGQEFRGGDGIISKGIESTLRNVTRLGKEGMKETDEEIIRIMTGC